MESTLRYVWRRERGKRRKEDKGRAKEHVPSGLMKAGVVELGVQAVRDSMKQDLHSLLSDGT